MYIFSLIPGSDTPYFLMCTVISLAMNIYIYVCVCVCACVRVCVCTRTRTNAINNLPKNDNICLKLLSTTVEQLQKIVHLNQSSTNMN